MTKKNTEVQEFRSSEFFGTWNSPEERSDLTGLFLGFKPPLNQVQWLPFRQGLNPCLKDILSSFQADFATCSINLSYKTKG
jgi:hypothetical protein